MPLDPCTGLVTSICTGTFSASWSHAASSSVEGESDEPLTVTPVTGSNGG